MCFSVFIFLFISFRVSFCILLCVQFVSCLLVFPAFISLLPQSVFREVIILITLSYSSAFDQQLLVVIFSLKSDGSSQDGLSFSHTVLPFWLQFTLINNNMFVSVECFCTLEGTGKIMFIFIASKYIKIYH